MYIHNYVWVYIWCVGIYYYKAGDVIYWGAGGLCEISIKPRCPLGGGPNARRRVSFGRTRSYLLPWRLTRPAADATHHYRRRRHWHYRRGIDCQLHARALAFILQHTAFYTRHTRSASSQRTGTAASEPYTAHTFRLSIVIIM